jgi:hypothetical protein
MKVGTYKRMVLNLEENSSNLDNAESDNVHDFERVNIV